MIDLLSEMKIKSIIDFMRKRKTLRIYYILLTTKEKRIYKQYIYSLNYKEYVKDIIWCYLNEPKNSIDYISDNQLLDLMRIYARNKNNFRL